LYPSKSKTSNELNFQLLSSHEQPPPPPKKERKVKILVSSLYLSFYSSNSMKRNHRGTQKRYRKESQNLQAAAANL